MAPNPPTKASSTFSSDHGDPVWFDWRAPADTDSRDRLSGFFSQAHIDSDAFIDSATSCRVDEEGNLILRREDGSVAKVSVRGLIRKLPPSIYVDMLGKKIWSGGPRELMPDEEDFLSKAFQGRRFEEVRASCGDGFSVHPTVPAESKPYEGEFLIVCHGRDFPENPQYSQECSGSIGSPQPDRCLSVWKLSTNFNLLEGCLGNQPTAEPITAQVKFGRRELTVVTGYKLSQPALADGTTSEPPADDSSDGWSWQTWGLVAAGGAAVAGGVFLAFVGSAETEPFPSGSVQGPVPEPEPGPGPGPGPGPQPQSPATGTDSGIGRRGGRGR